MVITAPVSIVITAVKKDVNCNGANDGSIILTVSGGTPAYAYAWSNGATTKDVSGLAAGTYTVTVSDSKGCSSTLSNTIGQPTALVLGLTATDIGCQGGVTGAIDLTVSGGVAPYKFAWSTGATTEDLGNLTTGTYTVTVTDANNCSKVSSATIKQEAGITVKANKEKDLDFLTNEVQIFANGSEEGLTYAGTGPNGFTSSVRHPFVNTEGKYVVTATKSNGCQAKDSVLVDKSDDVPEVEISVEKEFTCEPDSKAILKGKSNVNGAIFKI